MENKNARVALHEVVGPLNDLNQKLVGKEGDRWLEEFKKFLRKEKTWSGFISSPYRVFLEYKTIKEAIKADPNLFVDPRINDDSFEVMNHGFGKRDIHIIHFNYPIESGEAIKEMVKIGMRPVNIIELLALGIEYPNLQRGLNIVALNYAISVFKENHIVERRECPVAILAEGPSKHRVVSFYESDKWHSYYRFAAVSLFI